MKRTRRTLRAALLIGVAVPLLSCAGSESRDTAPDPGGPPRSGAGSRPGDRWFDVLDRVRVEDFPATNLPPALRALAGESVVVRSDPVPVDQWDSEGDHVIRRRWPGLRLPGPGYRIFWCRFPVDSVAGAPPPVIVKGGRRQERWVPGNAVLDGEVFWYDGDNERVYAIAETEPEDLTLEYLRELAPVLETFEVGAAAPPVASSLKRRVILEDVVRDALLLPAPGAASLELEAFGAEGVELAVGVIDRAWALDGTVVVPTEGLSDGVTFRIEVEPRKGTSDAPEVTWSRHVLPGEGFVEARVDLARHRGQDIRLRLVSDPGPGGDPSFDYAVWADLRFRGTPAGPPDRPHVVIVDIDTLRSDRTSLYGHTLPTTPRLDRWAAAHATVFEDSTSASNWTRPSTASMLTGLAVSQHQVGIERRALAPAHQSLAVVLSEAGYETRGIVGGGHLWPDFGFDIGFEVYDFENEVPDWDGTLAWLAARRSERPVFLFFQTFIVHAPYRADDRFLPDSDFGGRFAGSTVGHDVFEGYRRRELELDDDEREYVSLVYDAGIRRMDEGLGAFLEAIEEIFAGEDLLVIVTSDHGEALFEHDVLGHGQVLYSEVLRVPLVVRFPGGRPGRSSQPASGLDIVPTVLQVAGLEIPERLPGHSLLQPSGDDRVRGAEDAGHHYAIQVGDLKLIRRGAGVRLFDLARDPGERHDIADQRPEQVRELTELLNGYLETYSLVPVEADDVTPSPETLRSLRALGYID